MISMMKKSQNILQPASAPQRIRPAGFAALLSALCLSLAALSACGDGSMAGGSADRALSAGGGTEESFKNISSEKGGNAASPPPASGITVASGGPGEVSADPKAGDPEGEAGQGTASGGEAEIVYSFVEIKEGILRGIDIDGIHQFLSVPYAEATERFKPAGAVQPWKNTRDATNYGPISPQGGILGSQEYHVGSDTSNNCQNLNIWTPGLDTGKRPVMVWLHGGCFSMGSANDEVFDGEALSRYGDVVVVGINHRLGVFGHLDLSAYGAEYRYSANLGMLDILEALRFIQKNIETFGGDPGNVTLFGQSGGGSKILTLMAAPQAAGLFHKAIIQSGATESMGVHLQSKEHSQEIAAKVLEKLGIAGSSASEIGKKLEAVDDGKLMQAAAQALSDVAGANRIPPLVGTEGYAMEWMPVVDGDFLPTDPVTDTGFAEAGRNIPMLIGTNLNEWAMLLTEQEKPEATQDALSAYIEAYPNEDPNNFTMVDRIFRLPALKIMSHKVEQGGAPVYAYVFTKQDEGGLVSHSAEIPYVFHNTAFLPESALSMADTMAEAWVNFARNGAPSAKWLPEWEAYDRAQGATMLLDDTSMLRYKHDRKLMSLIAPDYAYWPSAQYSDALLDTRISALVASYTEKLRAGQKNLDFSNALLDPDNLSPFPAGVKNSFSANRYTGDNYISVLSEDGDPASAFVVTYAPGCISNWHSHTADSGGGEILLASAGRGYCQMEAQELMEMEPGDAVLIPAGVKHWHGARQDSWFQAIEIRIPGSNLNMAWAEPVPAAAYSGR